MKFWSLLQMRTQVSWDFNFMTSWNFLELEMLYDPIRIILVIWFFGVIFQTLTLKILVRKFWDEKKQLVASPVLYYSSYCTVTDNTIFDFLLPKYLVQKIKSVIQGIKLLTLFFGILNRFDHRREKLVQLNH